MDENKTKAHWCEKCPSGGRLLPLRKGWLTCPECDHKTADEWGLTDRLTRKDYERFAHLANQLRETRKRQQDCDHGCVTISLRPYCSLCGLVLPRDHPLAVRALERIEEMKRGADGPLAGVLGRGGA